MIRILNIVALALIVNLSLSFDLMAQAFDCAKASTVVEKEICDNFQTGLLDSYMADSYKQALNTPGLDPNYVKKTQRDFIKAREGCARSSDLSTCVSDATAERIVTLEGLIEPFLPRPQGPGDARFLTGKYAYNLGSLNGEITVTQLPGDVLSLDYGSDNAGYSCAVENLTIPRSEAERYVANNSPVPFYGAADDFEIKITYFGNGIQFNEYSRRNNPEDDSTIGFCGMRGIIYDGAFYAKVK
jgi:uncharacterized protein YecT (DUF1311 family)